MKLYHVSKNNKNRDVIDMKTFVKNDMEFVGFLLDSVQEYNCFYQAYNSEFMQMCVERKGWSAEKIASEAVFEYIRKNDYTSSPSRLSYAYFTDSIEKAMSFNKEERENEGAYFVFEADEEKVYYYDMDLFDMAVRILENDKLTENSFRKINDIAKKYWLGSKEGNTEILYKGNPVLEKVGI